MFLQKTFTGIKHFIIKLMVWFLPRPDSAPEGSEVVTERGIKKIVLRLFAFLVGGMCLALTFYILRYAGILKAINQTEGFQNAKITIDLSNPFLKLTILECLLFTMCLIWFAAMPFLRYMYKWLKVTGPIYAVSVGFILTGSMSIQNLHDTFIDVLAIICTAAISLLPIYLLKHRNLMLQKQLAKITYIAFAVVTLGGSVIQIFNQIPYIGILAGQMINLSKYDEVRTVASGIKAFIAFLFMFLAYDRMRDYEARGVSKKYEWLVAFTGFYTVCVIVLKVSDMLGWMIA